MKKLLLIAVVLIFAGCSKVSKENYDKLSVGMSYDDVVSILGSADNCNESIGVQSCKWGNDKSYVSVQFIGGKASLFSNKNIK